MSSSDGSHDIEGSNREGASFTLTTLSEEEAEGQHNYSVTKRWRDRAKKWDDWYEDWQNKASVGNFDTLKETLDFPDRKAMYLTEESDEPLSPLGELLSTFGREAKEKIDLSEKYDPSAAKENSREITTDNVLYQPLRKALFTSLRLWAGSTGDKIRLLSIQHNALKNKIAVNCSHGNETQTGMTATDSRRHSLDSERFDKKKVASPPDIYKDLAIAVEGNGNLCQKLSNSVSEEVKKSLLAFQKFVSGLFKVAKETDDETCVDTTIKAILEWKEDGAFDGTGKDFARPPTHTDRETKADQPILHALVCRIIRIIDGKQDYGVTTEQAIVGSSSAAGKARRIDCTAQLHTEHLATRLPAMVHFPLEIKTAPAEVSKFKRRVEKGRLQTLGRNSSMPSILVVLVSMHLPLECLLRSCLSKSLRFGFRKLVLRMSRSLGNPRASRL